MASVKVNIYDTLMIGGFGELSVLILFFSSLSIGTQAKKAAVAA